MDTPPLSERDISSKFIIAALTRAGRDVMSQVREEVYFTEERINERELGAAQ